LLDDHQAGLGAEEDLVGGDLLGAGAASGVKDLEQGGRLLGGDLGHAAERRHGWGLAAEQDGQKASGDGEADAFGLGSAGELGLAFGVAGDNLGALAFELGDTVVQPLLLLEQFLEALAFVAALNGAEDLGGVAVEGLSGGAAASGALRDGAVAMFEDSGSVGDAECRG
jgi:hypothetical protein